MRDTLSPNAASWHPLVRIATPLLPHAGQGESTRTLTLWVFAGIVYVIAMHRWNHGQTGGAAK